MNVWYRFWFSRVGLGLMGALTLYWAWEVFKNPAACSWGNINFLVCGIGGMFGNVAASVFLALLGIVLFYCALRPGRGNWA